MRKIEKRMNIVVRDLLEGRETTLSQRTMDGRTCAQEICFDGVRWIVVAYRGNIIAELRKGDDGNVHGKVTLAGWPTVTTRSRLNALAREFGSPGFFQCDGQQYVSVGNKARPVGVLEWVEF